MADQLSFLEAREWHSFNNSNFWFYDKAVTQYGNNPAVLFLISKTSIILRLDILIKV